MMVTDFFENNRKPLFLAPMAELTHYPFRKLLEEIGGVDVFYTEMLSSEQIVFQGVEKSIFLKGIECERGNPLVFQLLGNDVEVLKKASKILISIGADGIDLNLGCSAPFVYKSGKGSGLLNDRENLKRILCGLRDTIKDVPFSVKMRIGISPDRDEFLDLIGDIVKCGVDYVVLHPRLVNEKFRRKARWEYIEFIKKEYNVIVVGNGDITDWKMGVNKLNNKYVDGIMIGREALSNPWIFREIIFGKNLEKNYRDFLLEFIEYVRKYLPEEIQLKRVKLFVKWFTKEILFGHYLWKEINNCDNLMGVEKIILDFFKS